MRARRCDSAAGTFTSPDQGGSGAPYGYAEANPLTHTDPLGLDSWRDPVDDIHGIAEGAAAVTGIACAARAVRREGVVAHEWRTVVAHRTPDRFPLPGNLPAVGAGDTLVLHVVVDHPKPARECGGELRWGG